MTWATKRRAIIVSILIALFAVLVVIPYQISHYQAPTCTDGQRNQGERGVDCGGPCSLLCQGEAIPLSETWTKMFLDRPGSYDVAALYENKNYDIGAASVRFKVTLFDANNVNIAEKYGETYAGPNDRVLVFANVKTGDSVPTRAKVEILPGSKWTKSPKEKLPIKVTPSNVLTPNSKPKLSAILTNVGASTVRDIDVAAIIYNKHGEAVGVSVAKIDKIYPDDSSTIYFTWNSPLAYNPDLEACEKPADVVLALDRSGSMQSDGKNPPQPLTQAKDAARQFVAQLSETDQAGYVSYSTDPTNPIDVPLSNNLARVIDTIKGTTIHTDGVQYTNIGDTILRAEEEFLSGRHNTEAKEVIVFLTDGNPNRPLDENGKGDEAFASKYAMQVAMNAKQKGVVIYTIGLGTDVNADLLKQIASAPEFYYPAASGAELVKIYKEIGSAICKKGPSVIEIIPRINNVVPANSPN